ncbi:uncharacterized protein LOC131835442 [Mustela lutreola]|uniref:uncharacterized protein LOC131835442 n=1 Tax=Mustela lutreola TaxID=9666 RepID=UPI002796F65D|nr:uncharacterized protein LOC131835442 [Mustela lutreola]
MGMVGTVVGTAVSCGAFPLCQNGTRRFLHLTSLNPDRRGEDHMAERLHQSSLIPPTWTGRRGRNRQAPSRSWWPLSGWPADRGGSAGPSVVAQGASRTATPAPAHARAQDAWGDSESGHRNDLGPRTSAKLMTDFPDVLHVFPSRPEPLSLRVLAADFRQPAAVGVTLTDLVLSSALRRSSQRGAPHSVQAKPPVSALSGFCAWDWAPCQAPHPQSDIRLWTLNVFLNPISCLIIWRR